MGKRKRAKKIKTKKIKEYLYLDNKEINSILAQFEDGIPQVIQNVRQSGINNSHTVGHKNDYTGKMGAKFLAEAEGSYSRENNESNNESASEMSQEAISTVYDDYAVDIVTKLLEDHKLLKLTTKQSEGAYVQLSSHFTLIDPSSMGAIFDKDAAKELMNYGTSGDLDGAIEGIQLLINFGKLVSNLFPDSILIQTKNALSIGKKEYFRMNAAQLRMLTFSKRKITIVGKIESIIKSEHIDVTQSMEKVTPKEIPQLFSHLGFFFLHTFAAIKPEDILIKPLAIYFE